MPRGGAPAVNHISQHARISFFLWHLLSFVVSLWLNFVRLPYLNCHDHQAFSSSSVFHTVLFSLEIFSHCKSNKGIFEKKKTV